MAGKQLYDRKAVVDELVPLLADGKPLAEILRERKLAGLPAPEITVLWDWMNADESIRQRISQAREDGGDKIAADCLAIADRKPADMVGVQHQKLMVETRLKLLAKWHPKRYGDKLELSGEITVTESPLAQLRSAMLSRKLPASQPAIEAEIVGEDGEVSEADCF